MALNVMVVQSLVKKSWVHSSLKWINVKSYRFVLPENKLFEKEKETVLSLNKPWKHQNANSKNRASRPEAVWSR
jgi:hypothetical protein